MALPQVTGRFATQIYKEFSKFMAAYFAAKALDDVIGGEVRFKETAPQQFNVNDHTVAEIIGYTEFGQETDEIPAWRRQNATTALNYLSDVETAPAAVANAAGAASFPPSQNSKNKLKNMNQALEALMTAQGVPKAFQKFTLDAAEKKGLNKVTRRSSDGKFVSREFHEYVYCKESGQINAIFAISSEIPSGPPTFGTFVDAVLMRKAIATYRKLRRLAYQKGSKSIAGILGTTPQAFFTALLSSGTFEQQCQAAAEDWNNRLD